MPPLPDVPNVIQITLRYTDGGDSNMQNHWYMSYTGTVSETDAATFAATVNSQWLTHIAPEIGNWANLLSVTVNDLSSTLGAKVINETGGAGTASPPKLSSGVAAVISRIESDKYRGGHSRIYVPGIPEGNLATSNTWSTTFQSALSAAWLAFITALIQNAPSAFQTLKDAVVHRYGRTATAPVSGAIPYKTPSVPLTTPIVHPVTSYLVNPKCTSQRRRNLQST